MYSVLFVCLSVCALPAEPLDPWTWKLASENEVKGQGHKVQVTGQKVKVTEGQFF